MKGPKAPKSRFLAPRLMKSPMEQPTSSAPLAAVALTMTPRRVAVASLEAALGVLGIAFMAVSLRARRRRRGRLARGVLDRRADALIGATATDIAAHGLVDVLVARLGLRGEQGRGGHDLARL